MFKKILLLISAFVFVFGISYGQTDISIGQWKSHLPFQFGNYLTQSEDKIYVAMDLGIMAIDKEEGALERMTKVGELSDIGVGVIKYHNPTKTLIVTYNDSRIDLIKEDEVITLLDIPRFTNIIIDKKINDIYIESDSTIFISGNYGISKVNLNQAHFVFTAFTNINDSNINIFETIVKDGFIYAATEKGIFKAPNNPSFNLQDFNNWQLLDEDFGFPVDYNSIAIASYDNKIYATINDSSLYVLNESDMPSKVFEEEGKRILFLTTEGTKLIVGVECPPQSCFEGTVLFIDEQGTISEAQDACVNRPTYAIEDEEGKVWFGDEWRHIKVSQPNGECQSMPFNSPYSSNAGEMIVTDNELWIATEVVSDIGNAVFRGNELLSLIDGNWDYFSKRNTDVLSNNGALGFNRIAVHPNNGNIFVGTLWDGLFEFDREENFTIYNKENSLISEARGEPARVRVTGLDFDKDGNLWIANNDAVEPIVVLRNDGTWKSFPFPANVPSHSCHQVIVDDHGNKWFVIIGSDAGLVVFNEGDMDIDNDEQYRVYTGSNSTLENNVVQCVEVDLRGDVWVGTEDGAIVFECGSNVFDSGTCLGSRRTVEEGEFLEYLLKGELVRTIAVDGANRKWFGTTNGVFVQSSNGEEQEAVFNVDNSPLFDNTINDITINQSTGEVFIATNKGVISYRAEATAAKPFNDPDAYAFPNPVKPDYEGPIAIKGLAKDADVKITNVNGQLVYETKALGGQAIWDGRDYNGQRASSGVYLVFSTSSGSLDTPDAIVTKILFIN